MRPVNGNLILSATDLSNHLSCSHLTQLDRKVALKEIQPPVWHDPSLEALIARGHEHEADYVEHLKKKGLRVINLDGKNAEEVLKAMKLGVDVIVQARLEENGWLGIADILMRTAGQSKLGEYHYEIQDTKLARETKAGTMLQLSLYSEILGHMQGTMPEQMHVVKPGVDFPTEHYQLAEFSAYYRHVKKKLEETIAAGARETYPDPVEHCSICRWWKVCDQKRHDDDHLSLVAGMRTLHIVELERQNISTLEQFANAEDISRPQHGSKEALEGRHKQAKIQWEGRIRKSMLYEFIGVAPSSGFNLLPEPNEGDVYFDIEGDAYYEEGGLEYLLGYAFRENGTLTYRKHWATTRSEEKKCFEELMKFLAERWSRHPRMYVYHFAPYEPSAIKRLARTHAIFEKEVDDFLRAERFVDLHAVFKESLRASVERYSLKDLERFTTYLRKVELHDASVARKAVELALEIRDFKSLTDVTLKTVEVYNEDDCLATEALHRWLEERRTERVKAGDPLQRPELRTGEATDEIQAMDTRSQALFNELTKNLPEDRETWSDEQRAIWLLAHQVDYFRREDKSAWWEFYRVHLLDQDELLEERKGITGLSLIGELPKLGRERNTTHRYKFPPQELSIGQDDKLVEIKGEEIGTVRAISLDDFTIDIKKSANKAHVHPAAVHVKDVVRPGSLQTSLQDFAADVADNGLGHAWPNHAAKDILMKRNPKLLNGTEGVIANPGEDIVDAAIRNAKLLDRSYLAIQGPPGTGKTYTGAKIITALLADGKKIGITAVSHKVIRNLSLAVLAEAKKQKREVVIVHKVPELGDGTDGVKEVKDSKDVMSALSQGKVGCGSAWLWAEANAREVLDYLVVDEAGQMSLSHVLAAAGAAKNIILLGDPQQLEQPQKGAHPEGSDVAALAYLLEHLQTIPEGRGLFLGITRRLHPEICRFTSELFYKGKLHSLPGLENQALGGGTGFDRAGLFHVEVKHRGNQSRSMEEVDAIKQIVDKLLTGRWTDKDGNTRAMTSDDILIVAPFNAQVSALRERLPGMRIGTVDKFQGQEAPVVIYSMTSSTIEDAPRGMGFLFNPNRLNVATSRAMAVCILVASPSLFDASCRTIDQMRWANGLSLFAEYDVSKR